MPIRRLYAGLLLLAATTAPLAAQSYSSTPVEIRLTKDTSTTRETRAQLERILATWDLSRWIFTRTIQVEPGVIPHSHPVLTLNTNGLQNDSVKAKSLIHEQLHWFLSQHHAAADSALNDLHRLYPEVPADDTAAKESMYLHTLIGVLELDALQTLFGEPAARSLIGRTPFYTWEYRQALDNTTSIRAILRAHALDRPDARM